LTDGGAAAQAVAACRLALVAHPVALTRRIVALDVGAKVNLQSFQALISPCVFFLLTPGEA
jgi:hypothetical protein